MRLKQLRIYIFIPFLFLMACTQEKNTYQGYVEGEYIYMASTFSGNLENLLVYRGQRVTKGTLLYRLDEEPQKARLQQAKAKLKQAQENLQNLKIGERQTIIEGIQAQITKAKEELDLAQIRSIRYRKLYERDAASKDRYDEALTDFQAKKAALDELQANLAEAIQGSRINLILAQEAEVQTAKEELEEARWSLSEKSAFAPLDGWIFDTFYWPGEFVAAGKPILALLAPQYIRIIFFLPEIRLADIKLGDKVNVTCNSCTQTYQATISYISPEVEFAPPVIFSRENSDRLVFRIKAIPKLNEAMNFHPGQPVYVTLLTGQKTNRITKSYGIQ